MTPGELYLDIVTLDKALFQGYVQQLSVPTKQGEITILPHHVPLLTALVAGEMKLKVKEGEGIYAPDYVYIAISGGFLEVQPGSRVNVIVDSALRVDEIDEKKALEAKEKAEKLLADFRAGKMHLSDQEFAGLSGQLAKSLAELKVVRRKKHH